MRKLLSIVALSVFAIGGNAQYQLPNSDFESDFVIGFNKTGFLGATTYEPLYWHGFPTMAGTNATLGRKQADKLNASEDVRPGSTGSKSVYITATKLAGISLANGVMTTGRVNSSSIIPDDASNNYNYSQPGETYTENGNQNTNFAQKFTGKPDAMKVWVKFDANTATQSSEYPYAQVVAVIHNANRYQDPEATDYTSVKVAEGKDSIIGENGYNQWEELTIPFDYTKGDSDDPQYILVSFSTNAKPGAGTEGDKLYIDDISMVYNSELEKVIFDGVEYSDLTAGETLAIDKIYNAQSFTSVANGVGATVSQSYNIETGVLTVVVKGNNISEDENNKHIYYIQFKQPSSVKTYTDALTVTVDGLAMAPQTTPIQVAIMEDGSYIMSLKNFILGDIENDPSNIVPVGNIVLTNLSNSSSNGIVALTSNQVIQIAPGEIEGASDEDWMGPGLGDVPVVFTGKMIEEKFNCNIDIDMSASIGQVIKVAFGKDIVPVVETEAVEAAGEAHVVLQRAFKQGWNTVCLPFSATPEEIGGTGAKAQAYASCGDNVLNFSEVAQLEAGRPYLLWCAADVEAGQVILDRTLSTELVPVTYGAYTFQGTYTKTDMQGKYGVAGDEAQKIQLGGEGSYLDGTRAYFTTTSAQPVQSMALQLEGAPSVTAIEGIAADGGKEAPVYDLSGRRVRQAVKGGVYIQGGKKVIK